ncbi:MAG: hypothetical protein COX20_03110 [Desulfobacterales bacterium CG23_combo_of_CG06-09_8_20_14_all_52_9]|nr:MAG: hypothetical protein COX20_03110 [Desulfobacterales bacterium CG23_combo_of_CG06-09_8_20_14_all_52_9]
MDLIKSLNRLNLTPRERLGIGAAIGAIFLFLVLKLLIFPFWDARHRMQRNISSKQAMVQEMQKLQGEYRIAADRSKTVSKRMDGRRKGFTLFSFMEDAAGKSGIKSKIAYMKPSVQSIKDSTLKQSSIEMKLESITSEELVDYLYNIETRDPLIFVRRLSLFKSSGSDGSIQAVLQVETIER